MNRLFLVRHGVTAWNAEGRYQGQIDIPLSEEGQEQACAARNRLREERFTACYTSALSRARRTAEILLEGQNCPLLETADLNEMNFGAWEGLTPAEILARYPDDWARLLDDPVHAAPTAGESRNTLQVRVERVLARLAQAHQDATLLIVAHGGTIRAAVTHFLHLPLVEARRLRLDNTAITIIDVFEDQGVLTLFNDTAHLGYHKPPLPRLPAHGRTPRRGRRGVLQWATFPGAGNRVEHACCPLTRACRSD